MRALPQSGLSSLNKGSLCFNAQRCLSSAPRDEDSAGPGWAGPEHGGWLKLQAVLMCVGIEAWLLRGEAAAGRRLGPAREKKKVICCKFKPGKLGWQHSAAGFISAESAALGGTHPLSALEC